MIYRSNLTAPDLRPYFEATTKFEVRPWSMGHEVPSDKEYEPDNGFMTDDEAAILWHCANSVSGRWCDIGARFGWTTAHIADASDSMDHAAVDRIYASTESLDRFSYNTRHWSLAITARAIDSRRAYEIADGRFSGWCIDANHDAPFPLLDAIAALQYSTATAVIVFHDFWGRPIRQGVEYLMEQGLKCRVYNTPAGMAVCWRGDFVPPDHVADPAIDWAQVRASRAPEFDFSRCL